MAGMNLATHLVTSGDPVRLSGMRPPGDGGSYALFAQYPDQAQWKDLNSFQFTTINTAQMVNSSERISVAGGASANPGLTTNITFVSTTGSGNATGTLGNGTASLDGFQKTIIAQSITSGAPYALSVTNLAEGSGANGTRTIYLFKNGDRADLVWNNTAAIWEARYITAPDILTVYLRPSTGNDSNNGLTTDTAVATLQRAIDLAMEYGWNEVGKIDVDGTVTLSSNPDLTKIPRRGKARALLYIAGNVSLLDTQVITALTTMGTGNVVSAKIITATGSGDITTGQLNGCVVKITSGLGTDKEVMVVDHQASGTTHTLRLAANVGPLGLNLVVGDTYTVSQLTGVIACNGEDFINASIGITYHKIRFTNTASASLVFGGLNTIRMTCCAITPASGASGTTSVFLTASDLTTGPNTTSFTTSNESGLAIVGTAACPILVILNAFTNMSFNYVGGAYVSFSGSRTSIVTLNGGHWYNSRFYLTGPTHILSIGCEYDAATLPTLDNALRDKLTGVVATNGASVDIRDSIIVGNTSTMVANTSGLLVLSGTVTIDTPCQFSSCSGSGITVASGGSIYSRNTGSQTVVCSNNTAAGVTIYRDGALLIADTTTGGFRGTGNGTYGVSVKEGGRFTVISPGTGTIVSGTSGHVELGALGVRTWSQIPANKTIGTLGQLDVDGMVSLTGAISPPKAAPASQAFGAVTANGVCGILTFTSTLAAATAATATITNSFVTATTPIMVQVTGYTGTYFTNGVPQVSVASQTAGSFVLTLINTHATNALTGTVKVSFTVLST